MLNQFKRNSHESEYIYTCLLFNEIIYSFPQNSFMQINQPALVGTCPEVSRREIPEERFLRLHS